MIKTIRSAYPVLIAALIITIISTFFWALINLSFMDAIDIAFSGNIDMVKLSQIGKRIMIILLISLPFEFLNAFFETLFYRDSMKSLKGYYIKKLLKKEISHSLEMNTSRFYSNLANSLHAVEQKFVTSIYKVGASIIEFTILFGLLIYINKYLVIVAFLAVIVLSVMAVVSGKLLKTREKMKSDLNREYTVFNKEMLSAFNVIKSNNLKDKIKANFMQKSYSVQWQSNNIEIFSTYLFAFETFLVWVFLFITIIVSLVLELKGFLTVGAVVLVLSSATSMISPILSMVEYAPKIGSLGLVFNIMENNISNHFHVNESETIENFDDKIEMKNISYSINSKKIFHNVNLSFERGKKYLILAGNGTGKTTFIKLLCKYLRASEGEIFVDGIKLNTIKSDSYYKTISAIEKKVFFFDDTIKNNITLHKDYSQAEIEDMYLKSGLKAVTEKYEDALNIISHDNGKNIPPHIKIMVAIARAIIKQSKILIIDDAFARLDEKYTEELENIILNLDMTIINISNEAIHHNTEKYDGIYKISNKNIVKL